ncbi:hypothetical protein JCM11641_000840 [Rhodosporidiobolus odoratus]
MSGAYAGWSRGIADSDDDDELQEDYRYTKTSTLWAIEATPDMLAPTLSDAPLPSSTPSATQGAATAAVGWKGQPAKSKMEECLRAVYATMKRRVVSSPKDLVGVLIWNTEDGRGTAGLGDGNLIHQYLLHDLAQVDAHSIRKMKELLEKAEEDESYLSNLLKPHSGQNVVADVFGTCNSLFRSHSPNAQNTIFLVTDNDDPYGNDSQLFEVAKAKRRDLHGMGFAVESFFIPPSDNQDFDLDKFWGEVITAVDEDDSAAVGWPVVNRNLRASLAGMVSSMRLKEAAKRVAFKVPFVLVQGLVIGVAGYNTIGEEHKRPATKVDLNTAAGEEVISKTVYKDGETGSDLNPKTDIKKYFQVGHSDFEQGIQAAKIFFSEDDIRKVKTLGRPPSLKLLGFKPRVGSLRFHDTVKHSYFIYPDEDRYSGSTRTFASLLKTMLKKDVVGLASFVPRTTGKPQVVVLIPQEEQLNSAGVATAPPGIHICQLPFADDIRDHGLEMTVSVMHAPGSDDDEDAVPDQPEVDIAKRIVAGYSKKYIPDQYPNPALNHFYETLAAIALDEELPDPDDKTIPKYEVIEQRIGKHIAKLKSLIPEDEIDPSRVQTSKSKRPVKKEPAASGPRPDLSNFIEVWEEKGAKMTIPAIKEGLRMMGLPVSGKKDELLEKVEGYLREHGLIAAAPWRDGMEVDREEEEEVKPKVMSGRKKRRVEDSVSD